MGHPSPERDSPRPRYTLAAMAAGGRGAARGPWDLSGASRGPLGALMGGGPHGGLIELRARGLRWVPKLGSRMGSSSAGAPRGPRAMWKGQQLFQPYSDACGWPLEAGSLSGALGSLGGLSGAPRSPQGGGLTGALQGPHGGPLELRLVAPLGSGASEASRAPHSPGPRRAPVGARGECSKRGGLRGPRTGSGQGRSVAGTVWRQLEAAGKA